MSWNILYRGPLSSCNYGCSYCPFAKRQNTRAELQQDAAKVSRFVDWVANREERIGVLFTPWGEALIHSHYQDAITRLSHLPNVQRVAIQTNLSCRLDWIEHCNKSVAAFWTTFHPTETSVERFSTQCAQLDKASFNYSVGVVGLREHFPIIKELRRTLPRNIYLWINAFKRITNYYTADEIAELSSIDPLFNWNVVVQKSLGRSCRTGDSVFSVDGDGDVRRCHFIKTILGNIYQPNFKENLFPRNCTNEACGCHIGYVHIEDLKMQMVYGAGLLERIPHSLSEKSV